MTQKKTTDGIMDLLKQIKHSIYKAIEPGNTSSNDPENIHSDPNSFDPDSSNYSEYRMNEVVSNRIKSVINDFIESAPIIEEAGFRIRDMEIELSVIPKLIPHFEKIKSIGDEERAKIIDKVANKKVIKILLKALFKADNFQQSMNMGNLDFAGIEIEITAIPAIRLLYKNNSIADSDTHSDSEKQNQLIE